jgi:hypothetical protein
MSGPKVPAALLERLGEDAGAALTAMISAHDEAQVEYVVKQCWIGPVATIFGLLAVLLRARG